MKTLITVKQADELIAEHLKPFKVVKQPLLKSFRHILREDIRAERDAPAFDKALMDGIAISYGAYKQGTRKFLIEGMQSAGKPALTLKFPNGCTEIMTGAVLTRGADVVIPIEHVQIAEGKALVEDGLKMEKGQCIRKKGKDHGKGTVLLSKGAVLNPPQVAICASAGKKEIKVTYKPRVALISTGDELVDIGEAVKPYQIRRANGYFMQAALEKTGLFHASLFHFPDNKKVLLRQIRAILENFDVLVFTGGVSKGKFDYVPRVLEELKVRCVFHGVKQRPGKPFWFGVSQHRKPVFALPGNPVSTHIGMYRYVLKHLKSAVGFHCADETATLIKAYQPFTPWTCFVPVSIKQNKAGVWQATPISFGGSGDAGALGQSAGFMQVPGGKKNVLAGFQGAFYRW